MQELKSGWNMPPGCFESDIPGNRPDDMLMDQIIEERCDECRCVSVCKYERLGDYCDCPRIKRYFDAAHEHPNPDQEWDERY